MTETPKVAFDAIRTSSLGKRRTIVTYTGTVVNIGNGMNPDTGKFTAPIAGTYLFHYQQTNLNVDHSWCHMYLNGKFVSIANARFPSATVSSFIIESLQFSQSYKVKSLHFFFTRDVRQMGSYQTK